MGRARPNPRGSPDAGMVIACDDLWVNPTVVIVDDHPGFRSSARALLEAAGFEVVGEAEDGVSARSRRSTGFIRVSCCLISSCLTSTGSP